MNLPEYAAVEEALLRLRRRLVALAPKETHVDIFRMTNEATFNAWRAVVTAGFGGPAAENTAPQPPATKPIPL